jgi:hypothetical protein
MAGFHLDGNNCRNVVNPSLSTHKNIKYASSKHVIARLTYSLIVPGSYTLLISKPTIENDPVLFESSQHLHILFLQDPFYLEIGHDDHFLPHPFQCIIHSHPMNYTNCMIERASHDNPRMNKIQLKFH